MEEKYKNQLTETVQFYFNRRGLNETAEFNYKVPGAGRLIVELHTKELLCYVDLAFIEKLVFALMPIGIMYELVNLVGDHDTPDLQVKQLQHDQAREFTNINTSTDVTMPSSKKNRK